MAKSLAWQGPEGVPERGPVHRHSYSFTRGHKLDKLPGVQRAGALGALPVGRVWEGEKA